MAALDYLKKKAQAGLEAGVKTLGRLKTGAVTTGGAAPAGIDYSAYDRPTASLGSDGKVVQNRVPSAPLAGAQPSPAVAAAPPSTPGVVRRGLKAAPKVLGAGLGVVGGGVGVYQAGSDIAENGANLDNTTDLAGNAALVGGSVLSAPVAVGAGSFLAGKALGAGAVNLAANTDTGRSIIDRLAGTDKPALANNAALDQVERENPNGELAKFRRGLAARDGVTTTTPPAAGASTLEAAPTPAAVPAATAAPAVPRTQQLTSQEVRGLNSGAINAAEYAPGTPGTGFVTNSEGGGTRFNAQPVQTAQVAAPSNTDTALARLREQADNPQRFGQARAAKAAETLLGYETDLTKNATEAAKAKAAASGVDATLQDKRAKEFYDQFVNNAFRLPPDEKGVSAPDANRNDQFLDFARENSPHFQTAEGQASLFALPAQEQNKIISELRAQFVAKGNVEAAQNSNSFFQKPGLSNKQVVTTGARESNVGDIPDIGLGNYVYSNLPLTNRNVVTTDRGAVLAEDFIGDSAQEGSYDRREKFAQLLKRGLRKGEAK